MMNEPQNPSTQHYKYMARFCYNFHIFPLTNSPAIIITTEQCLWGEFIDRKHLLLSSHGSASRSGFFMIREMKSASKS
ncbi:hypothetical protein AAZX31_09G003400 [Glycine max]